MNNIRLTEYELRIIISAFKKNFLEIDHLWLFGSRVDLAKKGGDIDLYIESNIPEISILAKNKIKFLVDVKSEIGEQKIDVIINHLPSDDQVLIYKQAKETGVQLV